MQRGEQPPEGATVVYAQPEYVNDYLIHNVLACLCCCWCIGELNYTTLGGSAILWASGGWGGGTT